MRKKIIFSIIFMFLTAPSLFAHQVWVEKRNGDFGVLYGHGFKLDPYDPAQLKEVKGFDDKGQPVKVEIIKRKESALISPKGQAAIISVFFDGGYYVKTTTGGEKITKREAMGKFEIVEACKSQKYSKVFVGQTNMLSKPLGLRLEIVPQKDPRAMRAGEILPIKVLFEGKPLEGAVVKAGCTYERKLKELPKTDKNGMANVAIEKSGNQLIGVSYKIPLKDDPDADVLSISTNIVFEVK